MSCATVKTNRVRTGISGLDKVLQGGLPQERLHLLYGAAGTGKTTLSFQFLMEGVRQGEQTLYVTLLQTRAELEAIAASHGWSMDGIDILELPTEVREEAAMGQTVFSPADVEFNEAVDAIMGGIEKYKPARLVLDSVSEMALLVDGHYQLRRQILKLKNALSKLRCTALFTACDFDIDQNLNPLKTLVHGIIKLDMHTPPYGIVQRQLQILKMRGISYSSGRHDFRLLTGGIEVYPRLEMDKAEANRECEPERRLFTSNVPRLDTLVGGGLEGGTSCLITGTIGSGKSTLASLYVCAAAERGEHSVIFCFDECRETFLRRSSSLKLPLAKHVESGLVELQQIEVGDLCSGEFMQRIIDSIAHKNTKIVVIDSLTGYRNAMLNKDLTIVQLHSLLSYLNSKGVLSIMILATPGIYGRRENKIEASYLADTVLLTRHFEASGTLRLCISVVKKRFGQHEKNIREFELTPDEIRVGPPLRQFSDILSGAPRYEGETQSLLVRSPGTANED